MAKKVTRPTEDTNLADSLYEKNMQVYNAYQNGDMFDYDDTPRQVSSDSEWSDFGNSSHDKPMVSNVSEGDLNEMRANDQGFWEKVGLGATKMVTTAGTTFLDNTVGFIWGVGSAIWNRDASRIYDNDFTNAMADFNEWCEKEMPHYSSKYEGWGLDFWGNFIGKDILQNAGFQIGTGLSLLVPGAMMKVPANAFKATKMLSNFMKTGKAFNTGNAAKDLILSTYAAVGEAGLEGLNNKRDFIEFQTQATDDEFRQQSAQLDMEWAQLVATKYGGDENAARSSMDFNDYYYKKQDLQRMRADRDKFIQKEAQKVGDMTTLANLALVGGTNFITFGKALTGYSLNKRFGNVVTDIVDAEGKVLKKNVWDRTAENVVRTGKYKVKNENYGKWIRNAEGKLVKDEKKYIEKAAKVATRAKEKSVGWNMAKDMFSEGLEEMNQEAASQYSASIAEEEMMQYEALAKSSLAYDDILKQVNNTWFSFGNLTKALGKVYSDPQQYRQFFGGMLGGVFSPHFSKGADGKMHFHLNNLGQQSAAIREENSTNAMIAEQINTMLNSDESKNYIDGLVRHAAFDRVKQGAVAIDSKMDYENADFGQFVSDVTMMANAGKLGLLQARLEGLRESLNDDDNLQKLCMQFANEETGEDGKKKLVGEFVDKDGNYIGNTDAERLKIRQKLGKRIDQMQKDITLYQKSMNFLDGATGGHLDHQTLATFVWEQAQLMNKYNRARTIIGGEKAKGALSTYLDAVSQRALRAKTALTSTEEKLKNEKDRLSKLTTPDGKPVEPSELQKKLEQDIKELTRVVDITTEVSNLINEMQKLQTETDDHQADKDAVSALFEKYKSIKTAMPNVFSMFKVKDEDEDGNEEDGDTKKDEKKGGKDKQFEDFSLMQLMGTGWWATMMDKVCDTDKAESMTADFEDAAKLYLHAQEAEKSLENIIKDPTQWTSQRAVFEQRLAEYQNKDVLKVLEKNIEDMLDSGDADHKNLEAKVKEKLQEISSDRTKKLLGKLGSLIGNGDDANSERLIKIAIENVLKKKKYKNFQDLRNFTYEVMARIAMDRQASPEAKQVAMETFDKISEGKKNVNSILKKKPKLKDFDTKALLVEETDEARLQKLEAIKANQPDLPFDQSNYQYTEESKAKAAVVQNEAKDLLERVFQAYKEQRYQAELDNPNDVTVTTTDENTEGSDEINKQREKLNEKRDNVIRAVEKLLETTMPGEEISKQEDIDELIKKALQLIDRTIKTDDYDASLKDDIDDIKDDLESQIYSMVDQNLKDRAAKKIREGLEGDELENAVLIENAFSRINKILNKIQQRLKGVSDNEIFQDVFDSIAADDGSMEVDYSVEGYYYYNGQVYRGHMVKVPGGYYLVQFSNNGQTIDESLLVDSHGAVVSEAISGDLLMPEKRGAELPLSEEFVNDAVKNGTPNAFSLQRFKELGALAMPSATNASENRTLNKKRQECCQMLIDQGVLDKEGNAVHTNGKLLPAIIQANMIMDENLTQSTNEIKEVIENAKPETAALNINQATDSDGRKYRLFYDAQRGEWVRAVLINKDIHYKDESGKTWTRNVKKQLKNKTFDEILREFHGQDTEILSSSKEDWELQYDKEYETEFNKLLEQEQGEQQPTQSAQSTTENTSEKTQPVTEQNPTETPKPTPTTTVRQRKAKQRKAREAQRQAVLSEFDKQIAELESMEQRLQESAQRNPDYHSTLRTVQTFKQDVEFVKSNYDALGKPKTVVLNETQVANMMQQLQHQMEKIFGNDVQFLSDEEIEQAVKDAQAQFSKKSTDLRNNSGNLTFNNIDKAIETGEWNQEALDELNNLITDIENGTAVFNRYDSSLLGQERKTFRKLGKIYESAATLLGIHASTSRQKSGDKKRKRKESPLNRFLRRQKEGKKQEEIIEAWAKANDLWLNDYTDEQGNKANSLEELMDSQWGYFDGQSESKCYRYDDKTVIKSINLSHYDDNLQMALDKFLLQQNLDPNGGLEIVGFGRDSLGHFQIIALQQFIDGVELTDVEFEEFKKNQDLKEENGWYNLGKFKVTDLMPYNIMKYHNKDTGKTEYVIIDADYRLSQEESEIDNSITSTQSSPIQFQIGKKARTEFENKLRKARPDMSDAEIKATLDFLHELADEKENNAYIKAAVTWVANKSITLPEDYEKTRQIFDVARKKNVDIQKYKTFGELMAAPEMQKKEKEKKAFDPDEAKTFSNKRTVRVSSRREFVVYDVEDTEEGQQDVVAAVAAHYESSPWCLATFTNTGKPTESSKKYWNQYNGIPRKIAFENGRPVAFCSDEPTRTFHGKKVIFNGEEYAIDDSFTDKEIGELKSKGYITGVGDDLFGYQLSEKGVSEIETEKSDKESWWDLNDESPQEKLGTWVATERTRQDDPDGWVHENAFTEAMLDDLENGAREEQEDWDLNFSNDDFIFSKSDNETYGFTNEGKIVLNKDKFRPDTPVHEYTHLWDKACMEHSPELWKRGVELMKQTDEWQRVIDDSNYANIKGNEDLVASEVHSRLSGMLAAGKAIEISANKRVKKGLLAKLLDWFKKFKDFTLQNVFGMKAEDAQKVTLEQFLSAPVADFLMGTDPRNVGQTEYVQPKQTRRQPKQKTESDFKVGDTVQYAGNYNGRQAVVAKKAVVKSVSDKGVTIEFNGKTLTVNPQYITRLYGTKPSENREPITESVSVEEAVARHLADKDLKINDTKKDITDLHRGMSSKEGKTIDEIVLAIKDAMPFNADEDEIRNAVIDIASGRSKKDIARYADDAHYAALDKRWEAEVAAVDASLEQKNPSSADNPGAQSTELDINSITDEQWFEIFGTERPSDDVIAALMADEDYADMMNQLFSPISDAERNTIDGQIADEMYEQSYQEYLQQFADENGNIPDDVLADIMSEEDYNDYLKQRAKEQSETNLPADFYIPVVDATSKKVGELGGQVDDIAPGQGFTIQNPDLQAASRRITKNETNTDKLDTFKPSISEYDINNKRETFLQGQKRRWDEQMKEHPEDKSMPDYRFIYDLNQSLGAFDYVKNGNLKPNQEVYIGWGKVGENSKHTYWEPVFFVKDEQGQFQFIGAMSSQSKKDGDAAKNLREKLFEIAGKKSNLTNPNMFKKVVVKVKKGTPTFEVGDKVTFSLYCPNGKFLTTTVSKVLNGSLLFSKEAHSLKEVSLNGKKTVAQAIKDGEQKSVTLGYFNGGMEIAGNMETKKAKAAEISGYRSGASKEKGHVVLLLDKPNGNVQLIPVRVATFGELMNNPSNKFVQDVDEILRKAWEIYQSNSDHNYIKNRLNDKGGLVSQLYSKLHIGNIKLFVESNKSISLKVNEKNKTKDDKGFLPVPKTFEEFAKLFKDQLADCLVNINEDVLRNPETLNKYIVSDVFSTNLESTEFRNAFFTVNPIDISGNPVKKENDMPESIILRRNNLNPQFKPEKVYTQGNVDYYVCQDLNGNYNLFAKRQGSFTYDSTDGKELFSQETKYRMISYAMLKKGIQPQDNKDFIMTATVDKGNGEIVEMEVLAHPTPYETWYYDPQTWNRVDGDVKAKPTATTTVATANATPTQSTFDNTQNGESDPIVADKLVTHFTNQKFKEKFLQYESRIGDVEFGRSALGENLSAIPELHFRRFANGDYRKIPPQIYQILDAMKQIGFDESDMKAFVELKRNYDIENLFDDMIASIDFDEDNDSMDIVPNAIQEAMEKNMLKSLESHSESKDERCNIA